MKRGGISVVSNHWAKANMEHQPDFRPHLPPTYLNYVDATNLYGWAMSQPLPYDQIRFCNEEETQFVVDEFTNHGGRNFDPERDEVGYVIEADLSYPPELADFFSEFPLLAEKRVVQAGEYSPYMTNLATKYGVGKTKMKKLITDLGPKRKFVLHYRNLIMCMGFGVRLDKIHTVVRFRQTRFLQSYISANTKLRNESGDNQFRRDFFKLLNNS